MIKENIAGQRFGKLVVLRFYETRKKNNRWECLCDCGKVCIKGGGDIKSGRTTTCGCRKSELARKQMTTHGLSKTAEFDIYNKIKDRTLNVKCKHYPEYGGRGIGISKEWESDFTVFYKDMGVRPTTKHTIERRDNNKGYSKENCYWATMKEQCNNRRSNVNITIDGVTKTATQWCEEKGVAYKPIITRIERGWSVEDAFNKPLRKIK